MFEGIPRRALYLCNREQDCKNSSICGTECKHTTNVLYAKNGPVVNIREWNTRFEIIESKRSGHPLLYYWEKEESEQSTDGKEAPGNKQTDGASN